MIGSRNKSFAEKFGFFVIMGLVVIALLPVFALLYGVMLWIPWTWAGIGVRFFSFLPDQWHVVSFADCCWLGMLVSAIKSLVGQIKADEK